MALAAPSFDSDEIIDDAIRIFGIADGYLTEFDSDRLTGLRQLGIEIGQNWDFTMTDDPALLILWFRPSTEGADGMRAFGRILGLMNDQPNRRTTPVPGDLEGNFDVWFDGGAVKYQTGISTFQFHDGSTASMTTSLTGQVAIGLADGRGIRLSTTLDAQRFEAPSAPLLQPSVEPSAASETGVAALRNAFGPFAVVFEPRGSKGPMHRSLLLLGDDEAGLALDQVGEAARAPDAPRFIRALFADAHWWPGFVAGTAYLWDREYRFDRRWLWNAIDGGNWATPQLMAIAFVTDKSFVRRVRRRIEAGSVVRFARLLSADPWRVEELGEPAEPSSKLIASMLGISRFSPALKTLAAGWRADPRFKDLLEEDEKYGRMDHIASAWLESVTDLFSKRGIELTPAETRPMTIIESVRWMIDDWVWRRRFPAASRGII